ncbi:MAG: Holliday junction branch migration DNA helicase RuvB [Planctomycetia bacterium TMED53]|nr:MAG: Holliday junction branch migration DNA helicase RuvB [Planctomycetia bacterium TMED53]
MHATPWHSDSSSGTSPGSSPGAEETRQTQPAAIQGETPANEEQIRPGDLSEFVGQATVVDNLRVYLEAARKRGEPLDHTLFSGMPGLGKTTLSSLIASQMGVNFRATSGPVLEKAKDLVGLLTELEEGDVLFIDEVHRISRVVEEYLYTAMEDFQIDILIDSGPNARSMRIHLPRFTLVAATTREGNLTAPFRARFGIHEKLEPYAVEDLVCILERSARILDVELDAEGARVLAGRCRGTPRIANRYLRRVRDFVDVEGQDRIDAKRAAAALDRLGVDPHGLDSVDRKILEVVARSEGTPVGVKTIAVTVGEEERTIEDVHEPFLIRAGFLEKTTRGRVLGPAAEKLWGNGAVTRQQGSLDIEQSDVEEST